MSQSNYSFQSRDLEQGIRKTRISRWLLLGVIVAGILGMTVFIILQFYQISKTETGTKELEKLCAIVNTLADHIDGDEYQQLLETHGQMDDITANDQDPIFRKIHEILLNAKTANNLPSEIYILTLKDGVATTSFKNAAFFGVSSSEQPNFRHDYTPHKAFVENYLSGGKLDIYTSENGTWVSAIAPIRNSEDQVVGVVEADIQVDELLAQTADSFEQKIVILLSISLSVLFVIVILVIVITRSFLKAQMAISANFDEVNQTYLQLSDFAEEIGKGNYEVDQQPIRELDNTLANALLKMHGNLEQSRNDAEKRQWSIQGIAEFAQLLRQNNQDVNSLCQDAVARLCEYVEARQGIIYLDIDQTGEKLEPVGAYAFHLKQGEDLSIAKGEGLIGQAWLNRESTFISEVPENFHKISSGLGEATPMSVLIVPMIHNDVAYGLIEISSLKVLEPHQIEFVEKITESIASTVSIVQVNARTSKLLEETSELAEKFKIQEEEMRQNTEELQATQEELHRRLREKEDAEEKDKD